MKEKSSKKELFSPLEPEETKGKRGAEKEERAYNGIRAKEYPAALMGDQRSEDNAGICQT